MKIILRIFGVLVVLVLIAVAAAYFLPRSFRVERSIVIQARPEVVFAQFEDLKSWKNWTAWHERDPAMKLSYSTPSAGVGAWSAWESQTEGNGKMTITAQAPMKRVVYTLEFPDMKMISSGTIELQPAEKGTRVVWTSAGDLGLNPTHRWFGLFMDKFIGKDFERGLVKLQALAEAAK